MFDNAAEGNVNSLFSYIRQHIDRIYYGWYVLGVASLTGALSGGSSQMFMGSMLLVITQQTGWSDTVVSTALLLGTISGGVLSPLSGALTDRHGPRVIMAIAVIAMAIGFALLGYASVPWVFWLGYVVARGAAQGVLGGVTQRSIAVTWFERYRGRALGIVAMAVPLGGAILAICAQWLLQQSWGWQEIFYGLAALTLLLALVPAMLILRRSPEAIGLRPDGASAAEYRAFIDSGNRQGGAEQEWSLSQALQTRSLRILMVAGVIATAGNGAVVFYHAAFLISRGMAPVNAVTALSAFALAGALASLLWGYLAERISERLLAIFSQGLAALAMLAALSIQTYGQALIISFVMGLLVRGESSLTSIIIARYFGRAAYGRIAGFMTSFQLVALGLGPVIAAVIVEQSGTYDVLYYGLAVIYLCAAVLFLAVRPPLPPTVD